MLRRVIEMKFDEVFDKALREYVKRRVESVEIDKISNETENVKFDYNLNINKETIDFVKILFEIMKEMCEKECRCPEPIPYIPDIYTEPPIPWKITWRYIPNETTYVSDRTPNTTW